MKSCALKPHFKLNQLEGILTSKFWHQLSSFVNCKTFLAKSECQFFLSENPFEIPDFPLQRNAFRSFLTANHSSLFALAELRPLLEAPKGLEVFFLSRILCVLKMSTNSGSEQQCESSRGRAASRKSQMRQRPEHKWQSQDTNLPGCKPRLGTLGRQLSEAT